MGKKTAIGLVIGATVLLAIGLIALFVYPIVYDKETTLTKGSQVYDDWVEPDFPVYMQYHMFTYTNIEEILAGGKPKVEELGMLSYKELQLKYDIQYIDHKKEVIYYNNKTYVFDSETSTIPEDQVVTVPNILLFTIYYTMPQITFILNQFYNQNDDPDLRNAASPFYEVEAGDLLWGYNENALLVALSQVEHGLPTTFGLQFNQTNDGLYQVFTGKGDDNKNRAIVNLWNNDTSLSYWPTEACNMINGTDGTIFPVEVDKDERLYIYNTQICRSIFLESEMDEDVKGVGTTKFVATEQIFEVNFEDNICYCNQQDLKLCLDGLLDVSVCYKGQIKEMTGQDLDISLIMSSPHFLYADPSLVDSIDGLNPNKSLHETFLNVETEQGIIMKASKRIQVNTNLVNKKRPKLTALNQLPSDWSYLMPLFWGDETLKEDQHLVDQVKEANAITKGIEISSYVLIGLSILLLILAILCVVFFDKWFPSSKAATALTTIIDAKTGVKLHTADTQSSLEA